jgi:hypothetical protein
MLVTLLYSCQHLGVLGSECVQSSLCSQMDLQDVQGRVQEGLRDWRHVWSP